MYTLAKFQPDMTITVEAIVLQSDSNQKDWFVQQVLGK